MSNFDPEVLIRIANGLADDAPVHVNEGHAERLRRVAEYAWLQGIRAAFHHSIEEPYWTPGDIINTNPYAKEEE